MAVASRTSQLPEWITLNWLLFLHVAPFVTASESLSRVLEATDFDYGTPRCLSTEHGYCEEVLDYPSNAIQRNLYRNTTFSAFFNRAEPEMFSVSVSKTRFGLGSTADQDQDQDEERVCDVSEKLVKPRAAKNKNGELKLIVNDGYQYQQFVKIETCRRRDDGCSRIAGTLPRGYSSRCAQKFVSTLLVAFNNDSGETYTDDFEFPVACVCLLRHSFYP